MMVLILPQHRHWQ